MSPWVRRLLLGIAALAALFAAAAGSGAFRPAPPPIAVTPELVASGRKVYRDRCHGCHTDIPLERRVAGWEPQHAYDVIGRLQTLGKPGRNAMPAFPGTDQDRRALAAWLSELGAGRVPQR